MLIQNAVGDKSHKNQILWSSHMDLDSTTNKTFALNKLNVKDA